MNCFTLDKEDFTGGKRMVSSPFPLTAKFSTLFTDIQGIAYLKLPEFKWNHCIGFIQLSKQSEMLQAINLSSKEVGCLVSSVECPQTPL